MDAKTRRRLNIRAAAAYYRGYSETVATHEKLCGVKPEESREVEALKRQIERTGSVGTEIGWQNEAEESDDGSVEGR